VKTAEKSTFPQKRTRKEKRLRSVRREKNLSGRHAARRRRPHAGQRGRKKIKRTIDLEILLLSPVDLFMIFEKSTGESRSLSSKKMIQIRSRRKESNFFSTNNAETDWKKRKKTEPIENWSSQEAFSAESTNIFRVEQSIVHSSIKYMYVRLCVQKKSKEPA